MTTFASISKQTLTRFISHDEEKGYIELPFDMPERTETLSVKIEVRAATSGSAPSIWA